MGDPNGEVPVYCVWLLLWVTLIQRCLCTVCAAGEAAGEGGGVSEGSRGGPLPGVGGGRREQEGEGEGGKTAPVAVGRHTRHEGLTVSH